ncbi:hypothetical protein DGG96_19990 [Legionella qingyii]|uniref:Uncharacterized protein n=1 Tax=Legionella qingyii TaxID=2184757 RepID=A0A317TYF7_9GAMM|nr:hypothetical protein DGG96_19990 [Legionella qingyii]
MGAFLVQPEINAANEVAVFVTGRKVPIIMSFIRNYVMIGDIRQVIFRVDFKEGVLTILLGPHCKLVLRALD